MRLLQRIGLLTACLALTVLFFVAPVRRAAVGAVLPFLRLPGALRTAVADGLGRWRPLSDAERARLRHYEATVPALELQLATTRQAQAENRALRAFLQMPPPPRWHLVVAPVIARDPFTWNRRFRIGAGASRGVQPGNVVLSGSSVIGRVLDTTAHTAEVVTLADPTCRLSVYLPARHAVGVVGGRVGQLSRDVPLCELSYLPRDAAYAAGDAVTTSGLGGTMPAGLAVGHLLAVEGQAVRIIGAAYAAAQVRPTADFELFPCVGVVVATPAAVPAAP